MKALSIRPDYAFDILTGQKHAEYRSWNTKHRGELLICSTAKKIPGTIPGHALCVVNITDVKKLADHSFAWIIGDNGYYIKPFKVKGQQGLFNIDDSLIERDPINDIDDEIETDKWVSKFIDPLML